MIPKVGDTIYIGHNYVSGPILNIAEVTELKKDPLDDNRIKIHCLDKINGTFLWVVIPKDADLNKLGVTRGVFCTCNEELAIEQFDEMVKAFNKKLEEKGKKEE